MPGNVRRVTAAMACLAVAAPVCGYVDTAPTLGRLIREADAIAVVEVDRFNSERGAVILKVVRDLKGKAGTDAIRHHLLRTGETAVDGMILDWAEPGRRGVLFASSKSSLVCMGEGWYQVHASDGGWWRLGAHRSDLPLAYYGTVSRLSDAVDLVLDNKPAVITTLSHGGEQTGASFDLALNRANQPGLVKVQRLRASLAMPAMAMAVTSHPAYFVGPGPAGVEELPRLRERLGASDAAIRAEAAIEVGSLGSEAAAVVPRLSELLDDADWSVRTAAAAALLRIEPTSARSLETLAAGLADENESTRRSAARAAGLGGPAAAALAGRLAALLDDSSARVRHAALQSIATLGPAAAEVVDAVAALLDEPDSAIDAADALGRIGPAARPALKRLSGLLSSESPDRQWAAVRAMSQIGGDAHPAVEFMIREMPRATQMESYNMMIYLALLGPVAKDAIPAIQRSRLMNPFLRQTTIWAIDPGAELPWLTPMGSSSVAQLVHEAYVQEVGEHLQPAAKTLTAKILAGQAGHVPAWGYKLLAKHADESLAALTPALADHELAMRERAAVAVGYMGRAAAAAKPQVERALAATSDEREQLLLKWCLREIAP